MADKFHISRRGTPALCRATTGNCPLANEDEHFATREEARDAFEKSQNTWTEEDSAALAKAVRDLPGKIRRLENERQFERMVTFLEDLYPRVIPNLGDWSYNGAGFSGNITYRCASCANLNHRQPAQTTNVEGALDPDLSKIVTGVCPACGERNGFISNEGGLLRRPSIG